MPYLVVENGNQRGLKVEIGKTGSVTLGRDPAAEMHVDDHLCSRRHYEVASVGGRYVLKDLGSSNGTLVNDRRVTETELVHGDCILAGETQATFLEDAAAGARGLIGKTVGGYRILERIGRGGMGTVYKSNQVSLNRVIALKILGHKVAVDPAFVKRFHKEAQAAGRLNHPNIVQVYDVGSDSGLHFYSMEYIENGSVQDLATREGKLTVDLSVSIILDAARGLEYAEKRGLVHRDIKPDNLMINAEGVVKIADLGLARDAGEAARESGAHAGEHHKDDEGIFGTPHFIAPEQAQGKPVDTRSDIYSLGATFYRLLAGATPFQGESVREIIYKQINEQPKPIREVNKDCPAAVAQIVERMMRKDPAERYATAADLVLDLEKANAQIEGRGGRGRLVAAAALVLVLAGGAYWFLRPKPPAEPPVINAQGPSEAQRDAEARRLAEIERADSEARAREARSKVKLEDVTLIGAQRDVAKLDELLGRFHVIADDPQFKDTETAEAIRKEDIARLLAEIAKLRENAAASEEKRRLAAEAATRRMGEIQKQVDEAEGARRFGAALGVVVQARGSPEVLGSSKDENLRALDERAAGLLAKAAARAASVVADAQRLVSDAKFEEAAGSLDAEARLFLDGLVEVEGAKTIRDLATRLTAEAQRARAAGEAKSSADASHDALEAFRARRIAAQSLSVGFDPDKAKAALAEARQAMLTEAGRQSLDRDTGDVDAILRLRAAFVDGAKQEGIRAPSIRLPSQADPARLLNYTLVDVTPSSFSAKLGQGEPKVFNFSDFKAAQFYELVLKGRIPDSPAIAKDVARMHVATGSPELALSVLDPLAGTDPDADDLKRRATREIRGRELVAEIRSLEKKAERDTKAWIEILSRVENFLNDYRDTLAFLLNSNGSALVPGKIPR